MSFDLLDNLFEWELKAVESKPALWVINDTSTNIIDIFSKWKMFAKSLSIWYRLYSEWRYEESLLYFKRAHELFPDNNEVIFQLWIVLNLLWKNDESLKYLQKVNSPQYKSETLFYIWLWYKNKWELKKALEFINIAITINPNDYEFLFLKWIILIDLWKYWEALPFLDGVKKINPKCDNIDYYIWFCYNNLWMYEEASKM